MTDGGPVDERVERYCELMHDAYEQAAKGAGWETQQASRKPWSGVPEANKVTMRAAVGALLDAVDTEAEDIEEALAAARAIGEARALDWAAQDARTIELHGAADQFDWANWLEERARWVRAGKPNEL